MIGDGGPSMKQDKTNYNLSLRNIECLRFLAGREDRVFQAMCRAKEKALSLGTELAGTHP